MLRVAEALTSQSVYRLVPALEQRLLFVSVRAYLRLRNYTRQLTGQCTLRRELHRSFLTAMCVQWRIKSEQNEPVEIVNT